MDTRMSGGYGLTPQALGRPDQRLREIGIKQAAGMPLTARDIKRLAARQGTEQNYAATAAQNYAAASDWNAGNKRVGMYNDPRLAQKLLPPMEGGGMAGLYAAANAPTQSRARAGALGNMAAEYGDANADAVQTINRARLNDEASWLKWRGQDFQAQTALRTQEQEMRDQQYGDYSRGRGALMRALQNQYSYNETPQALRAQQQTPDYMGDEMRRAVKAGDMGVVDYLNSYNAGQSKAGIEIEKGAAQIAQSRSRAEYNAALAEQTKQNMQPQEFSFTTAPDGSMLWSRGKSAGVMPKAAAKKAEDPMAQYYAPTKPIIDPDTQDVVYPTIYSITGGIQPNPKYAELLRRLQPAKSKAQPQDRIAAEPQKNNAVEAAKKLFFK